MDNPVNQRFSDYLFTTEGHILPIGDKLRTKSWVEEEVVSSPKFEEEESLFFRDKTPKIPKNGTQPTVSL